MEQLITIDNGFGRDIEIDKNDYIERWSSHMKQLYHLNWESYEELSAMIDRVEEVAGKQFDELYAKQHPTAA